MLIKKKHLLFLTLIFLKSTYSAKILCIASVPTFSHNVFFRPICKALADRGHELTVLTTNPMDKVYPNIREIDLNFVYERKATIANLTYTFYDWPNILRTYQKMFADVAVLELNHPEVQTILKNEAEHFDLVIAEMHIPVMFGFAHRFKCPLIGISSADIFSDQHALLGNPTHPILYPDVFLPYAVNSFFNRLLGSIFLVLKRLRRESSSQLNARHILKTYFGTDTAPVEELIRNVNLVFLNTHPIFNVRPLGPKFVTIGGGSHIQRQKELPKILQELMDSSTNGVVYFSLGTNVKKTQYPPNFINTIIEVSRELPYQFIWKLDYDIPNLPGNVKIFKWVPQQDLLRHKNVKVFITQGGIHSMEEAICAEIPMIGIPFMSDQNRNAFEIVNRKFGVSLDKDTMTKDDLKRAIKEIVTNPIYKNEIRKTARLLKDQPMTGLEKAIWYTEYTIRNKDANDVFSNTNLNIPWYQYFFLDVIAALMAIFILSIYLLNISCRIMIRVFGRRVLALVKSKTE